ncbi:unnamed protein product [Rotaria sp. Silwood1]|nr:unnamed protein product [Rotaria sp. Silwood1]
MADLCHQNPLNCLNDGQCAVNIALNTTYCNCTLCKIGPRCETDVFKWVQLTTDYMYLIIILIGLLIAVLNNTLSLEVFLGCSQVRRTNCGIYLIVYSLVSLLSSIILVLYQALHTYADKVTNSTISQYFDYNCYFGKIGYNGLVYFCIWLSSFVACERGLIVCFGIKTNATRWRSFEHYSLSTSNRTEGSGWSGAGRKRSESEAPG